MFFNQLQKENMLECIFLSVAITDFIPGSWSNEWLRLLPLLSLFNQDETKSQAVVHSLNKVPVLSVLCSTQIPYNQLVLNVFELNFLHPHNNNNVKSFSHTHRSYSDKFVPSNVYYICVLSLNISLSNEMLEPQLYKRKKLQQFLQCSLSMPRPYRRCVFLPDTLKSF